MELNLLNNHIKRIDNNEHSTKILGKILEDSESINIIQATLTDFIQIMNSLGQHKLPITLLDPEIMEEIYVNLTENAHIPDILLRTEVLMEMVGIDWTIIENNLMYKINCFSETNQIERIIPYPVVEKSEVVMRNIKNSILFSKGHLSNGDQKKTCIYARIVNQN